MDSIFKRVSVRDFTDKSVESDKIDKLLKAAFAAPSAGNQQPWEYYVVTDKEVLSKLSTASPYSGCAKDCAVAIVPCYKSNGLKYEECVMQDMSAATENILLEAAEQGLGGVWLGIAPLKERIDAVVDALGIPDTLTPFSILAIGYPKEEKKQQDRFDESKVHYVK